MGPGSEEPVAHIAPPAPTRPDLAPVPKTFSRLAIASVVLPLVFPFSSVVVASNPNGAAGVALLIMWASMPVVGLICGIVALTKIRRSGATLRGKGLAIAGTVLCSLGTLLVLVLFVGGA
jgi:Domain of unknown function (DUF4190)